MTLPAVVRLAPVILPEVVIVAVVKYAATLVFEYVPPIPDRILTPLGYR